jgi:tetratricopeptide (TPR) repeat protein
MPVQALLFLFWPPFAAQVEVDRYPRIRPLITAGEEAALKVVDRTRQKSLLGHAAQLYSRAGYLDDAARMYASLGLGRNWLIAPMALYGDAEAAIALATSQPDPIECSQSLTHLAKTFWRMGDRTRAARLLEKALVAAAAIAEPKRQKTAVALIVQLRTMLPEDAPLPLSPVAGPDHQYRPRAPETAAMPAFPITADGFRPQDNTAATARAAENGPYLTRLYALMEAGGRDGVLKHAEGARTCFQKALALASIEHILIAAGMPKDAQDHAGHIAEDTPDCVLAKAEALSAAGAAWGRAGRTEESRAAFAAALDTLRKVPAALAFGRVAVAASISRAQASSGLVATSGDTFATAIQFAAQVPMRPKPVNGVYPKSYSSRTFRDDAYRLIVGAQLDARDFGGAFRTADLWRAAGADGGDIAFEFLSAGYLDEAVRYARSLHALDDRAAALLWLAGHLLDDVSAPVF